MINNKTPYASQIAEIEALIPECYRSKLDRIVVEMSMSLRTTGGCAAFSRFTGISTVSLNATLFATLNDAERREILSHEIAHAVLQVNGLFVKHGFQWQSLHRKLGGTAERTHHHEVKHNLRRRVVAFIPGKGHLALSIQKYNKLRSGAIRFLNAATVIVGIVKIDMNTKTYVWESLMLPEHRDANIFKGIKLAA